MKNLRRALLTMWVMAGLVLAIACLNFANLLTARAAARQQELAVRVSLGGRRLRLARQLVMEALVLVGIGGGIGVVLAHFGAGVLVAALPEQFLGSGGVRVDAKVVGFALIASATCGVVFAALPALRVSASAERSGSLLSIGALRANPPKAWRTHIALTSVQVALTLALLVGAALFVKSFWQLARIEPGYQAKDAVTLRCDLPGSDYPDSATAARLTDALGGQRAARPAPGGGRLAKPRICPSTPRKSEVRAFTVENGPPDVGPAEIAPPGLPPPPPPPLPPAGARITPLRFFQAVHVKVGPGFFDAMGIPLVAGRDFTAGDRERTAAGHDRQPGLRRPVLPRHGSHWPAHPDVAGDAMDDGRRCRGEHQAIRPRRRISLGILSSVRPGRSRPGDLTGSALLAPSPQSCSSCGHHAGPTTWRDPPAPSSPRWIPRCQLRQVATLQGAIDDTVAQQRLMLRRLFLVFAVATLIVAAVGVYGVTTYVVGQRQHEMAVHASPSAHAPSSIEGLIVSQALPVIAIGVVLGMAASAALSPYVGAYLFRVTPLDAWVHVTVAAILAVVVAAANYLPARRAGRTDPLIALKGL